MSFTNIVIRTVKGLSLPKQDIDDVLVALYRLELTMSNRKKGDQTEHVMIKLVTIVEQFFRCIVQFQLEDNPNKGQKEITLNPLMIDEIIDIVSKRIRRVTAKFIVSLSHSFQNPNTIENTMNGYGINIFSGKNCLNKEKYEELFKLRHEFVHTINPPSKPHLEIMEYYKMTEELIQHVLDKYKGTKRSFDMLKGKALRTIGGRDKAKKCFEAALKRCEMTAAQRPNYAGTYSDKGDVLLELERYDEALECYDKVVELNTDNAWVHYRRWMALFELERYDEALECIDKVIKMEPNAADMHSSKGATLLGLKRCNDALEYVDKAISKNPYAANLYFGKGTMLANLKKYDEALECYDKVIELDPHVVPGYYGKWNMLSNLNRHAEALEYIDKVIELEPYNTDLYYNKSSTLAMLKRYDESLECDNKAKHRSLDSYEA